MVGDKDGMTISNSGGTDMAHNTEVTRFVIGGEDLQSIHMYVSICIHTNGISRETHSYNSDFTFTNMCAYISIFMQIYTYICVHGIKSGTAFIYPMTFIQLYIWSHWNILPDIFMFA